MSKNVAVAAAFLAGEYTDARGTLWVKGMDGWFDRSNPDIICLAYHHDMAALIEKENQ